MYNNYTNGSRAWEAYQGFIGLDRELDSVSEAIEGVADEACAFIEELETELAETEDRISELETELAETEDRISELEKEAEEYKTCGLRLTARVFREAAATLVNKAIEIEAELNVESEDNNSGPGAGGDGGLETGGLEGGPEAPA